MLLPGSTLGVLGGGQLGRLFVIAARNMGYRTVVLDADPQSPAGLIADQHIMAGYEDRVALDEMAVTCDAVTTEFENVPASSLRYLAQSIPVSPPAEAVEIAQNRGREKDFARQAGVPTAPFYTIHNNDDIAVAASQVGFPGILKLSELGYDGKGQVIVNNDVELATAFAELGSVECVLEKKLELEREVSVILARNAEGDISVFPVGENVHVNGILHTTTVPASISDDVADKARDRAIKIANQINYVGVLAVEFFITRDGHLVFNEMAPRPHNSGHYTIDACVNSQFDQQARVMAGLVPGDTRLISPVVMVNLLGDLWPVDWSQALSKPALKLHLYGKTEARPGRKMGHYNVLAESPESAHNLALLVFKQLNDK